MVCHLTGPTSIMKYLGWAGLNKKKSSNGLNLRTSGYVVIHFAMVCHSCTIDHTEHYRVYQ